MVGAYLAWVLSNAMVARYTLPWLILLVVPAAAVLARLCQVSWQRPFARMAAQGARFLTPTTILGAALVLGPLVTIQFWLYFDPLALETGQLSPHAWEARHIMDSGYWGMVSYVEATIPKDARLLLVGRGTGYFLDGFDYVGDSGEDWIPYLETEGKTPAGMLALLRHDHFAYVIYEERTLTYITHGYGNSYLAAFLPAFRQFLAGSLTELWTYDNFHVYQMPSS